MRSTIWGAIVAVALGGPAAAEEPVVQDVLDILKDRGIVDEGQYNELTAKNQGYEEEHRNLLGRIEFSGDLRIRLENFWYDRDTTGTNSDNRTRMRYRLRVQGKAAINDYVDAVFRIASGELLNLDEGANRTTNRTLGRDNDFGLDTVFIDQAYLELKAPSDWMEGVTAKVAAGKLYNPFRWKVGKDFVIWDADISPEGLAAMATWNLTEGAQLFLNTGYFIADENGSAADPHVFGAQGGVHVGVAEGWATGVRASFYSWDSLDEAFFTRASRFGNVPDGLTSGAPGKGAGAVRVGELAAYVRYEGIPDWPLLLYGHYARNFDAVSSDLFLAATDREDTGWGIGVEAGDKKRNVAMGLGYYHLEANYAPAQFIDSDITDGFTNRAGWHVYAVRELLPNTDLSVELMWDDELRSTLPDFEVSARDAERIRLRTDVQVKF